MYVAVERTMDERGLHPHLHAAPQHELAVDAALLELVEAIHRDAAHALHADDPRAAVVPVDLGRGDPLVVAERVDVVAELGLAVRLEREVQLLVRDLVEVLDDRPARS